MKFLLDTNIISELRKRERAHPNVIAWVQQTSGTDIGTSVVVLAEIRRGIALKRRNDPAEIRRGIHRDLRVPTLAIKIHQNCWNFSENVLVPTLRQKIKLNCWNDAGSE